MGTSSVTKRTQAIPASGRLEFGPGNFFFLTAATAAVTVEFYDGGNRFGAENVDAGYVKGLVNGWRTGVIIGTAGVVVSFLFGTENFVADFTDFRTQIATIGGTVLTTDMPSSTFATTVAETALADATSADIAANLSRRRLTINASSGNTGSLWIRDQAATTNGGIELHPGLFVEVKTTAALRIRNNSGAAQSYSISEET